MSSTRSRPSWGEAEQALQLHLGGGTPNFLSAAQLEWLNDMLERRFGFASGAERSVEADPRLVSRGQLVALRGAGFRRISYGVQDFDPLVRQAIGRSQPESECGRR